MSRSRKRRRLRRGVIPALVLFVCLAAGAVVFLSLKKGDAGRGASGAASSHGNASSHVSSGKIVSSSSGASSVSEAQPDSLLMLVNKDHAIPTGYNPTLVTIPTKYYYSAGKDESFDSRAASHLTQMLDDAAAQGVKMVILSGHRTYQYQQNNFNNQVAELLKTGLSSAAAQSQAAQLVAPPGTSEHETGLACDIINPDWYNKHKDLTGEFDQTAAYAWLSAHAADYGFILRYPKDKTAVTMYDYEPWHYRYVGADNAHKIDKSGLCLEEYLKKYPQG